MKKFLSLVLALVMTMSLVTISAGAAEYKDLTDKDEITYEEAVAVLNRIGIITGYSDGSFQPKKELTRGAAAKIIVSLLIGTDAASNLVATTAPYTDVPVNHTFAGVISYCKTSKIINGYTDGSFKPEGTLSGYAFAKMLLGALGYKSEYEGGFTGAGWTMNVARLGGEAGLFDRLSFKGNETVNREQACQLALNTLKATLVEYTGGMTITSGDATITGAAVRSYKTSNQDFAENISNRTAANSSEYFTVEFGEEHFVDLKLEHDKKNPDPTPNDLGQPSAEWSYKKVTIGTYPLEPDFTYDHQMAHEDSDSDASKVRALGLSGYKITADTVLWVNGDEQSISEIADIADYTDNGTIVEVYISNKQADVISDVVVIKTQLMEVRRVGSDYVSLQRYDDNKGLESRGTIVGYNQAPIDTSDIENIEVEDNYYEFLHGLKAGDVVAVVPVAVNHDANDGYEVWDAYTPETVSGKLTKVTTYGKTTEGRNAVSVTVGGTEYKIALWNKDLKDIRAEDIQVTVKDVTLHLDKNGYALLAEDVGSTSEYMVIKGFYDTTVNNRIVKVAEGWDMDGNELSLNLGVNGADHGAKPGDLVQYSNEGTSSTADWKLNVGAGDGNDKPYIYDVNYLMTQGTYEIKSSNTRIALTGATDKNDVALAANTIASGIKFIYVNFNETGDEVESIEIIKGMQNVSNDELRAKEQGRTAQAYTNKDLAVKAVVIKDVSSNAISNSVAYIRDWDGEETYDGGKRLYRYTVAMVSPEGYEDEIKVWTDEKLNIGDFASYTAATREGFEPFYRMHRLGTTPGKVTTGLHNVKVYNVVDVNNGLIRVESPAEVNISDRQGDSLGIGDTRKIIRVNDAKWLYQGDAKSAVTGKRVDIRSAKELDNYIKDTIAAGSEKTVTLSFVFNDNVTNDGFRTASLIIVRSIDETPLPDFVPDSDADYTSVGIDSAALESNLGPNMELNTDGGQFLTVKDDGTADGKVTLSQKDYDAGFAGNGKNATGATITYESRGRADATLSATSVRTVRQAKAAVDAVPGTPAVEAHYEADTSVTSAETFATAIADHDLYTKSGEGDAATYTKVVGTPATYAADNSITAENFVTKVEAGGVYVLEGENYVEIEKANKPPVYDEGTLGSALTSGWVDGTDYYTKDSSSGADVYTKVDTTTVTTPDSSTTYYTITTPGVEDGEDFNASTTYYKVTAAAVDPVWASGTTYYKYVAATPEVPGTPAQPAQAGVYEISFTVPANAISDGKTFVIKNVRLTFSEA